MGKDKTKERRPGRPTLEQAAAIDLSVIKGARALFCEQGPSASMDDIAAAVGVTKLTVYRRFPSKEALLFAVLDHDLVQIGRALDASVEAGRTGLEKLYRLARAFFDSVTEPSKVRITRLYFRDLEDGPALHDRVARWRETILSRLTVQVEAAQQEGSLVQDDAAVFSEILLELISAQGERLRYGLGGLNHGDLEAVFEARWSFFLRGASSGA